MIGTVTARSRQARAVGLLAAGLLLGAPGCRRDTPQEAEAPAPAGTPEEVSFTADQIAHGGVRWSTVAATSMADSTELPGHLVVDEDRTARLSPAVKGRVTGVRANAGETVTKGQVLVTLQSEESAARRAELQRASAELAEREAARIYARSARARAERLLDLKAGSAQDVERTRADEAAAESAVQQAQAAVEHARTVLAMFDIDADTGQIQLRSPIAGVVVTRDAVQGAVIEAGASALVVTDPASLWLEFGAPDGIANALAPGQHVRFVVPAFPDRFDARILGANGAVDPTTRLVTVRAAVANAGRKLRPEMFTTVQLATSAPRSVIAIPHDAVQLLDERPVVFIAEPDGKGGATFKRRAVKTGSDTGGQTQVTDGIAAGDVVVTDGAFAVKSALARGKMPAGG
jgi:membrane fusion protein, heavy metal efflux system